MIDCTMRPLILIAALAATSLPASADGTMGGRTVDCYCTDTTGSRIEIGEMTCLHVDGKTFMAQCRMALNVPIWRKVSDGCVMSSLPQRVQPTLHARLVDAHVRPAVAQPRMKRQFAAPLRHRGVIGKSEDARARDIGDHPLAH
jgi:hypothetical protein